MKITFIGGGNMAAALLGGLIGKGHDPAGIRVVEIQAEARARLAAQFGVVCADSVAAAAPLGEAVVLAVKPQQMRAAAQALQPRLGRELVITIAAGIRLVDLSRWLGGYATLVRCMPNTPALIGAGITGLYANVGVGSAQRALSESILGAVGATLWVPEESLLDPVTAISGSGPAYVFYFIEAVQQAAQEMGFSAADAKKLAVETFVGTARLAAQSPENLALLRERVTSKGGTTERALASMDADRVKDLIVRALHAANRRARELGEQLGTDK
ncbi:MAG: pyrroline-5-carboxylate reductase [Betaproteobacteria bacterium]|nr:pyrroline-5-carboxylate reductase [Betaproteobacteria bacterium]